MLGRRLRSTLARPLAVVAAALLVGTASPLVATSAAQAPIASRLGVNRCMDVFGGSRSPGAEIALWDCNGGANQQFAPQPNGEIRVYGSLCVDALGGNGRDGDKIGIYTCNGGRNQKWSVSSGGQITGINGKCIDVPNSNSANGTRLVLWSCNGGMNQRWNTGAVASSSNGPAATVKKLYVIDGTDSREVHHNSMYHVYERWSGPKYWQNGVNLMATNIDAAYNQVYNTVCQDVRPSSQGGSGVTDVYLAGYSRGAMMAIKLANEARQKCGANVRFLGLVDAVNSSIWNWPTTVNPGIPVAVHIRKMSGYENVLTTRDIDGVTRILNPENVSHQTMTCNLNGNNTAWKYTRDELIRHAQRAGGTFGPSQRETTDCIL